MKKITIALLIFVSLTLFSNKLFSQQDSTRAVTTGEQMNNQKAQDAATIEDLKNERDNAKEVEKDAVHTERAASDATKQSKSALKAEKKAQKSREKAEAQKIKAEKARKKTTE